MIRRLIENDIRANKLSSAATFFFMAVSAMLLCLTVLLGGSLLGSIDHLMEESQTPDFLQMHAGEADEVQITAFAEEQKEVEQWQLCRFLNLENAILSLNGRSLSGNTQDNGLCVQSPSFDYLLDTKDHRVSVQEGEVYVPVCYRREYGLEQGQLMQIGSESLRIAGFIRDSQMNSMMDSSKRFLVNEADSASCWTTSGSSCGHLRRRCWYPLPLPRQLYGKSNAFGQEKLYRSGGRKQ